MPYKAWHRQSVMHGFGQKPARFQNQQTRVGTSRRHQQCRGAHGDKEGFPEDIRREDAADLEKILGDSAGRLPKQLSVSTSTRSWQGHNADFSTRGHAVPPASHLIRTGWPTLSKVISGLIHVTS